MKEKILKLRLDGKSYSEIKNILGCSKSTISYYCGDGQKEKNYNRTKKNRSENHLITRVDRWNGSKFKYAVGAFRKGGMESLTKDNKEHFNYKDVIKKFGMNTICYLTGEKINLLKDKHYNFDHIIPVSRGGNNLIDNLGILHEIVNRMKFNLTNEEFIGWCIKILRHNGYKIKGKNDKRAK
jgi:CRISPR/Cas system Type II protein with McrA/HNH and RuvC-like nuclease domain